MRLLERDDVAALTTNAVAEKAGVSIGTLYQYFDGKQAVLDALAGRELEGLSKRVLAALKGPAALVGEARVRAVVRAALGAYGGRRRVHRLLLEHALTRGPGTRLDPLYAEVVAWLAGPADAGPLVPLTPARAFVLAHAIGGVLRAYVASPDLPIPREEVEDALVELVGRFATR